MRTLFEDTEEQANREDDRADKHLPVYLWVLAVVCLAGAVGTGYWAAHRKPPEPPPVVVSLDNDLQVNQTLHRFGDFAATDKWEAAQGMLSAEGLNRIEQEKKPLRESLLGKRKDSKVLKVEVLGTRSRTPSTLRVELVFFMADGEQKIVPITLVQENNRLAINSW